MQRDLSRLLEEALKLSPDLRVLLASRLLGSVDAEARCLEGEGEAVLAFLDRLERVAPAEPLAEVIPWEEVRRRIFPTEGG